MKKRLLQALIILGLSLLATGRSSAQNVAVKTNLLYDLTTTANAGLEFGLAPKWTFDVTGNLNPWVLKDGLRLKHAFVLPELRYWFCERFNGHFLGVHAIGGIYNIGMFPESITSKVSRLEPFHGHRFQGWGAGAGVAYGYDWILSKHWNLELEIGAGAVYTQYNRYECKDCDNLVAEKQPHTYVGPTKAALNLVYAF